jgi:hypothetical protein
MLNFSRRKTERAILTFIQRGLVGEYRDTIMSLLNMAFDASTAVFVLFWVSYFFAKMLKI